MTQVLAFLELGPFFMENETSPVYQNQYGGRNRKAK